jgi:outer membrane protein assembly factor BamB
MPAAGVESQVQTVNIVAEIRRNSFAYIGAVPNPVGVNQQILLHVGITQYLESVFMQWHDITVTVTKPDGTTETLGPYSTDSTGGTGAVYIPNQVGTYTFQTHFPEQHSPSGMTMEADDSDVLEVVVQQDPIPVYTPTPLPEGYWTRPIDAQHWTWNTFSANWVYENLPNLYAPYNEYAPDTAHILWAKELEIGGLAGGNLGSHSFDCGDAYEGRFDRSVIIAGKLFYNRFMDDYDNQQIVAVDLHTGEELWIRDDARLDFGQVFYWDSYNYHGAYDFLWDTPGRDWVGIDPTTGEWACTIEDVPGGDMIYEPNGNILKYDVDVGDATMTLWNFSRVVSDRGSFRPYGRTLNGERGIEWTKPIPSGLKGDVNMVLEDRIIGCNFGTREPAPDPASIWAISTKPGEEGTLLFDIEWDIPVKDLMISITAASVEDGVFTVAAKETMSFYGFSLDTGELLWGPTESQNYMDFMSILFGGGRSLIAYGKLFSQAFSGILYAYDINTGVLEWTYSAHDELSEILWTNQWHIRTLFATDGKIYSGTTEHSPVDPKPRGGAFVCVDAETGEEIWRADGLFRQTDWGGRAIIGDSIIATMDTYDQRIYAIAKGPTKLTCEAPLMASDWGQKIVLRGTVTDISPGTQTPAMKMRFPHGVPAVSDGDMSEWMLYVYKQFEMPMASGVPVKLEVVVDPNYNWYDIGTAYTDASGFYCIEWEPPVPGLYLILATFEGSDSYYPSYVETAVVVSEGLTPGTQMEFEQPTMLQELTVPSQSTEVSLITIDLTIILAVIAVAIIGIGTSWYLRKK